MSSQPADPNIAFLMKSMLQTKKARSLPDLRDIINPVLFGASLSLTVKAGHPIDKVAQQFTVASRRRLLRGLRVAQAILARQMRLEGVVDFELTQQQMNTHLVKFARAVSVKR